MSFYRKTPTFLLFLMIHPRPIQTHTLSSHRTINPFSTSHAPPIAIFVHLSAKILSFFTEFTVISDELAGFELKTLDGFSLVKGRREQFSEDLDNFFWIKVNCQNKSLGVSLLALFSI